MSGYYLMHRGWMENPVFRNEAFSRRDAFVWLIENAAYSVTRAPTPRGTVELHRGQLCASLRYLAKAWRWDEAKVRRFLQSLQKEKIIDASTDAGQTVVTICNYDKYQLPAKATDAPDDAAATQQRRGGDANINKGNTGKESLAAREGENHGDMVALMHSLHKAVGLVPPDPSLNWGQHADSLALIASWIDAGADPDMLERCVAARASNLRSIPKTLKYFDGAVRDALRNKEIVAQQGGDMVSDILARAGKAA